MNSDIGQSQKYSSAGRAAIAITVFVLIWDSFVFGLLVPIRDIPFWFKAIFVVAAFGVTTLAVFTWRNWILSGSAQLQLSSDPVPHGVTVSAKFELTRKIRAQNWSVEASLDEQFGKSSLNTIWSQKFPAQRMSTNIIYADFVLPSEYSPKNISKSSKLCQRTLTLKADHLTWSFLLKARNASNSEKLFGEQDEASIGNNLPTYTPEDLAKNRRYAAWIFGTGFIVSLLIAIGQFASIFDFDLISRAKAQVGLGAYSSKVTTEEFDVRVTNYAMNNWAFRGRLVGKGRVNNGEFRVRVESLDLQATNECNLLCMRKGSTLG